MNTKANPPVIVCGTDLSVRAAEAANVARALAQRCGGKLLLLHALAGLSHGRHESPGTGASQSHLAAASLHDPGSGIEASTVYGRPDKALVEAAIQHQARMIVVGAIEPGPRLINRSVAVRTAESATVPTLIVGESQKLVAWTQGKHSLRIVMDEDFSAAGDSALRFVADLEKLGPCEITVAHVAWPPKDQRGLATESRADLLVVVGAHPSHGIERFRLSFVRRNVLNNSLANVLVLPRVTTAVEPKTMEQTTRPERLRVPVEA
jgi:nucleotide-binding universal stress UspA family protein